MMKGKLSVNHLVLAALFLMAVFLEFFNIGKSPIEEWDEARRGINAISMINNGDYLHYYFLDQPDGFVNKPPLATWLITINFRLFGYNAFALRLHSVFATIIFFIFSIKLIRLYKDLKFTLIVLSILVTIKGIIGFHVGRTGDTDSLLVLFLTAAIYFFLRYWDFADKRSLYFSMLFAGLAFYSKGLAMMLIAPGVIGIMAFSWKKERIFNRHILFSLALLMSIIATWYLMASLAGPGNGPGETNGQGIGNLWQGLWQVDGVTRFFGRNFEEGYNPWFLLHAFDSYFNVWNYILYAGLLFLIIQWIRKKKISNIHGDRLFAVSAWLCAGLALMLILSYNKHRWYFAPGYLFLSIITAYFIEFVIQKRKWIAYIFIGIVWVLSVRRVMETSEKETSVRDFFEFHAGVLQSADQLLVTSEVRQNYVLPYIFMNPGAGKLLANDQLPPSGKGIVLLTGKSFPGKILDEINGYRLIQID